MDMVDAGIGRLLISSLHQGIADVSPTRLDFYENWLSPTGLRDGRMGLAPLGAVLSFLHREEPPANRVIPAHAGALRRRVDMCRAPRVPKRVTKRLPLSMRTRAALGLGRTLVNETISQSKVKTRMKNGEGVVEIRSPLFEYLREPSSAPMRRFYAAAYAEFFRFCEVEATINVDAASAVLPVDHRGSGQPRRRCGAAGYDMTTAWRMGGVMLLALQLMLLPAAAGPRCRPARCSWCCRSRIPALIRGSTGSGRASRC